jgi:excisionase family DNA binding protein
MKKPAPKDKPETALQTVAEVAVKLDVCQSTVIRMILAGSLPAICIKTGRRKKVWRFRREVVERWLVAQERQTARIIKENGFQEKQMEATDLN